MLGIGGLITAFTRHRVSADVLMLVFLLSGVYAMTQLPVRFFPPFETNTIVTVVVLPNSTPADVEESVVVPLENALRNVPDYTKIFSYSRESSGTVILEFPDSVDLSKALEDVKAEVERVSLPEDAEAPESWIAEFEIKVANMTVVGTHPAELRKLTRALENDLNAQGLGKVTVEGIPAEEILVLVDQEKMIEMGLSIAQVGAAVAAQNRNASVGSVAGLGNERKIRSDAKTSDINALYDLPVTASAQGDIVYLREIATIEQRPAKNQIELLYNGRPAASLVLQAEGNRNIIDIAEDLQAWADRQRAALPASVQLVAHDEEWRNVQSRLSLLVENGMMGMALVICILFLFLSRQIAFWVAAGIPVAMFATLFVFHQFGGTINMISMFALIMAVGIIVDDAIVVGENAQHRLSHGAPPMRAVTGAAKTMFTPVFASSFTTVSAFMPLFIVTGPVGAIIFDIPLIIVCILIAALLECFLVLPGHLYRSFAKRATYSPGPLRASLDNGFRYFRERIFRPASRFSVNNAMATATACLVMMFLAIGLLANGFVPYRFFPGAEGNKFFANVEFASGTPRATVAAYVDELLAHLEDADAALHPDERLVAHAIAKLGYGGENSPNRDSSAQLVIELVDAEFRELSVNDYVEALQERAQVVPGITKLEIRGEEGGPPGKDIEIRLAAQEVSQIKPAAQRLKDAMATSPGLQAIADDTPYGKEEVIFSLTPLGRSLNVDIQDVADQLRFALSGYEAQSFTEGVDEIDLRVLMAGHDSDNIFATMYLRLDSGEYVPMRDIVTWRTEQGFETILHQFGQPAIVVSADLADDAPTTVGAVLAELEATVLEDLYAAEGITYSFEGSTRDEQQTAQEMMTGMVLALVLIYIILTWVFNSWSLPIAIMITMPLGVIGTILGHWAMGVTMSILSFFGMFTLMGIIVNNSIVLVDCFKGLGVENLDARRYNEAIVEASCLRLRAVLLTTLTTVGGLTPLMFETSVQAQFLLPMAISICFGLGFATVLILFFMPACLALHGAWARGWRRLDGFTSRLGRRRRPAAPEPAQEGA
ncbi:MAG: efflux RND transporter permease subunit [Betaproteobacteria bacterium AqS2]|uniref:Efflux RND transporter permease subunit n=1 Tax=Candidatus Amphirhobacter heronislandensis TaxID=1732024 RepID=A0A930UCU2_9GAMM|nr:efflux RND transporter permease subunit [Betaproteobacteria bacterium AqS2]